MIRLHRSGWIAAACVLVAVLSSACSAAGKSKPGRTSPSVGGPSPVTTESAPPGDIPDNQAFVAFRDPKRAFRVEVPEGWAMTKAGSAVLFTDKYNSIRVESRSAASRPNTASATSTELPAIRAAAHGFLPGSVRTVQRDSGPAVLITYRADSSPNPVTNKVVVEAVERYEFWRSGTEVVLTLAAPVGSDNVDPWRKVTDSFSWQA